MVVSLNHQTIVTTWVPASMHIIHSAKPQQQRIKHYVAASDAFSFFNQLTSPELLETMESTLPEHRERLFPPTETLSMFLAQDQKVSKHSKKCVLFNIKPV